MKFSWNTSLHISNLYDEGGVGKGRGERTAGILAIGVDAQLLDDLRGGLVRNVWVIGNDVMAMRRRNSLRHAGWNYAASGFYFVTVCTYQRQCLFERAELRAIVERQWQKIPAIKSATTVQLDEWIVMPNHVHGIIVIVDGLPIDAPRPTKAVSGSIGSLVGTFKSSAAKRINNKFGEYGSPIWQRGYYDKIIRNERQLNAIRQYIIDNPARWAEDRENLDRLLEEMTYHPS